MDTRDKFEARRNARDDLARVLIKDARRRGDYGYTERQARSEAAARADVLDRKRDK